MNYRSISALSRVVHEALVYAPLLKPKSRMVLSDIRRLGMGLRPIFYWKVLWEVLLESFMGFFVRSCTGNLVGIGDR